MRPEDLVVAEQGIEECFTALGNNPDLRRATFYDTPKFVVKVTRQRRVDRRDHGQTFIVTVGRPNYAEREYIRVAKKAGQPFPFGPIYTYWPKKRAR